MNKLSFSIETDAPYSAEEIEDLREGFILFMEGADQDVDSKTAKVSISDANADEDAISQEQKEAIFVEMLDKSNIVAHLTIANGGIGFSAILDV